MNTPFLRLLTFFFFLSFNYSSFPFCSYRLLLVRFMFLFIISLGLLYFMFLSIYCFHFSFSLTVILQTSFLFQIHFQFFTLPFSHLFPPLFHRPALLSLAICLAILLYSSFSHFSFYSITCSSTWFLSIALHYAYFISLFVFHLLSLVTFL